MTFFLVADSEDVLLVSSSEEALREIWTNYWTYRYDFNLSFCEFLRENGIYARKVPPSLVLPASEAIDIEICPN